MSDQQNYSKPKPKLYKRPEFIFLLLTALLWIAFLLKVFHKSEVGTRAKSEIRVTTNEEGTLSTKPSSTLKTNTQEAFTPQVSQARSRNRLSIEQLNAKKEQQYIEAIRESFEKIKPSNHNQIIRGEFQPVTKDSVDEPETNIQNLVNDRFEMESLNAEYKRALKGRN